MKAGGAYIEVRADDSRLPGDLAGAHRKIDGAAGQMQRRVSMAFKVMAAAAVASVGIMAVKILALGREFESTMKTVQAWSGAAGKDLKDLTDIARKMGATTEWTANQAASALKYLAAAGFTAKQSIEALPGTLDLATAGQVDLARATDITTDVLTAFGMEVAELSRVSDAFITTSSSSNTNVLMLGESFKMVAPTAHLFGLSVEQTAAMLGTLANSGIKAEMAGSGLNMVLMRSAKAAKMLGLDAMTPLVDILKRMKEEQWSATQIGDAFGVRQVKTAAILMNNIEMYEKLTKKILDNKGATTELAAVIRDSLDNDLKVLNSTIQDEMLSVYDEYKGSLREIVQETTTWIQQNDELIKQRVFEAVDKITSSVKSIVTIFNSLPDGVTGAAGVGIIARILSGSTPIGVLAGSLVFLNTQLKKIGMNIGSWPEKIRAAQIPFQNLIDVAKGKRDWQTGEILGAPRKYPFSPETQKRLQPYDFMALVPTMAPPPSPTKPPPPPPAPITPKALMTAEGIYTGGFGGDEDLLAQQYRVQKMQAEMAKQVATEKTYNEERLAALADFNIQYNAMGKSRFDLEREQLDAQKKVWEGYHFDNDQIAKLSSDKFKKIKKDETVYALGMAAQMVGGVANSFLQMSQAGGEHSKKAFRMYQAFAIAQAIMSTAQLALAGGASLAVLPVIGPALAAAWIPTAYAMGAIQIAMIASAKPPSYDEGGISRAKGIYQTGDIDELHIPLKGGKVPLKGGGGGGTTIIVKMENPVFQDVATQRQVFAQIATVIATKVAPGAVIQNYRDDGPIRSLMRGRA